MSYPAFTPRHLVIAARVATPLVLGTLAFAVMWVDCTPVAAVAAFVPGLCVLIMGAPRTRAGDLVGALVMFMTLLECLHAATSDSLDLARWQACVAAAGAIVLLLKVQHLRGLARQDAYVPLRQLERRGAVLGRTRARSVPVRREA